MYNSRLFEKPSPYFPHIPIYLYIDSYPRPPVGAVAEDIKNVERKCCNVICKAPTVKVKVMRSSCNISASMIV